MLGGGAGGVISCILLIFFIQQVRLNMDIIYPLCSLLKTLHVMQQNNVRLCIICGVLIQDMIITHLLQADEIILLIMGRTCDANWVFIEIQPHHIRCYVKIIGSLLFLLCSIICPFLTKNSIPQYFMTYFVFFQVCILSYCIEMKVSPLEMAK